MNNLCSDIMTNIIEYLQGEDIINLQRINKNFFEKEYFNMNYIWKNCFTSSNIYNFNHGKIVKNLYYSKKYNLCSVCFNILEKKKILILCSQCNIRINEKNNIELFLFHAKCFSLISKFKKFSRVFSCVCPYCNNSVMGCLS